MAASKFLASLLSHAIVLVLLLPGVIALPACGGGGSTEVAGGGTDPGGGADPGGGGSPTPGSQMGGAIQGSPLPLTGSTSTLAGQVNAGTQDGVGTQARFRGLFSVTTDGTDLYVADNENHAIRKVTIATGRVTTLAGVKGETGREDGIGMQARFYYPAGITTDGTSLFVADTDNHTIRRIEIATGQVTTMAGTAGSEGSEDGTGTAARFRYPHGITTDGVNLYVADTFNHTIRRIAIATGRVTTFAGAAGSPGSGNGAAGAARFNTPYGITTDGVNLYVADTDNHTIRRIDIATGQVTTPAGTTGVSGSADGTGTAARFRSPSGVTTDGNSLYVADTGNNEIRRVE